jgi:Uma2 family endonuclease
MANDALAHRITYADYVLSEATSEVKHEWLDGEVFAMAGGNPEHAALAAAMQGVFSREHAGKPCRPFSSDLRVRVQATGLGTYPDITVVCNKLEVDPDDKNSVVNPTVLVEILSASTESYDRGKKFAHYKQIPSLAHYVLVATDRPYIEWLTRAPAEAGTGVWIHRAAQAGERVVLSALDIGFDVDAIYSNPLG